MKRRTLLQLAFAASLPRAALAASPVAMEAWRNPGCGCCEAWTHLLASDGFAVAMHDDDDLAGRQERLGIAPDVAGCHVGVVNGYAFSGHVPPADIRRFLDAPPEGAVGLAVPGMPVGSPGMEYEGRVDPYEVVLIFKDGRTEVFASYGA